MYIGIDIGGTKCAVLKGDGEMNITEKVKFATSDCQATLARIFDEVERLLPCDAIGISCGGPLDEKRGIICSPPNLPGWDDIHITDMLGERFGVPAYLCNDANACALAEWRYGAGVGTENMVFMTFGTGLGAGLIINGRLYSGTNGNAGELGHIRLEDDGPVGYGKAGSFEGFCSGGGIKELGKRLAKKRIAEGRPAAFCKSAGELDGITTKLIADYAKQGDADALAVFKRSAEQLGKGLSVVIDILNPEVIVIGSIFARCEELFTETMNGVIAREALAASSSICKILPAKLGEQIGDIAALTVAAEGVRNGKL